MGVTYSRRAVKGGFTQADENPFFIGKPLTDRVNTFIAIAGRNWGIPTCNMEFHLENFKICNKLNGGYPGTKDAEPYPKDISLLVKEMNLDPTREGDHTYAIFSMYDQPYTFSRYSAVWPTMDEKYVFTTPEYDHVACRDNSTEIQYNLVTYHSFNAPNETVQTFL